jgi:hypothetical protein
LRTITLILFLIIVSAAITADDKSPPDIETLMSAQDYVDSGLDKLTAAEREHLSEWVARYRDGAIKGPAPVPKKPSQMNEQEREVFEEQQEVVITAKVLPAFRGWSGKTVFHLDNGQVWQQRIAGKMRYSGDDSTVVITQNLFGKYVLEHVDSGRAIGVKRIR